MNFTAAQRSDALKTFDPIFDLFQRTPFRAPKPRVGFLQRLRRHLSNFLLQKNCKDAGERKRTACVLRYLRSAHASSAHFRRPPSPFVLLPFSKRISVRNLLNGSSKVVAATPLFKRKEGMGLAELAAFRQLILQAGVPPCRCAERMAIHGKHP